jgi:hypothetical protein
VKPLRAAGALVVVWIATAAGAQETASPTSPANSAAAEVAPTSPTAPSVEKPRGPLIVYLPREGDPAPSAESSESTERVKAIGRAISGADRKAAKSGTLTAVVAVLFGGVALVRLRRRARNCPRCLTPLSKLGDPRDSGEDIDEKEAQAYAASREAIWSCHLCGEIGTVRHGLLFSASRSCPTCARRTLTAKLTPIEPSGYLLYGLARVDEFCPCGYEATFLRSTPPHEAPNTGRGGFRIRR